MSHNRNIICRFIHHLFILHSGFIAISEFIHGRRIVNGNCHIDFFSFGRLFDLCNRYIILPGRECLPLPLSILIRILYADFCGLIVCPSLIITVVLRIHSQTQLMCRMITVIKVPASAIEVPAVIIVKHSLSCRFQLSRDHIQKLSRMIGRHDQIDILINQCVAVRCT